jgi:hypothetical protein
VEKTIDCFFKERLAADGRKARCKECHTKITMEWSRNNPTKAKKIKARHGKKYARKPEVRKKQSEKRKTNRLFKALGDEPVEWVTE